MRDVIETPLLIRIDGRPPTLNSRRDWHVVARDNAQWKRDATLVGVNAVNGTRWRAPDRVALTVTFLLPDTSHRRDWDNLVGSIKPLLDGLVDAGVMRDDSLASIATMDLRWRLTPGYTGTEFAIAPALDASLDMGL